MDESSNAETRLRVELAALGQRRGLGLNASALTAGDDELRASIFAGWCPFCDAGPFDKIVAHTARKHGVSKRDLCELASLYYSNHLTSGEYYERTADRMRAMVASGAVKLGHPRGAKHRLSPAAVALQAAKGRAAHDKHPHLIADMAAAHSARAAERRARSAQLVAPVYSAVLREHGYGYGVIAETARRLGLHEASVRRSVLAARELGILGSPPARATTEDRVCVVCGADFRVSRSDGWGQKACGGACGAILANRPRRIGPRAGVCVVCGKGFTYVRAGTAPKKTCSEACCREANSRAKIAARGR